MRRRVKLTISVLIVLVGLAFFTLAPVYTWPTGPPAVIGGKVVHPTMDVSSSYYFLGFGLMSVNTVCGHRYYFELNRALNVSC